MSDLNELKDITLTYKLLYVEDSRTEAQAIINYLSNYFKEVIFAENGEEALALYKNNNFDIVLTDINMPKMNGLDLSYEIKQINKQQLIILMSSSASDKTYLSSIQLGIDGYLIKPINYTDLNNLLLKLVKIAETEKENNSNRKKLDDMVLQMKRKNSELSEYVKIFNQVAIVSKTNLKGKITYVNDIFCEVSGYTKEELIGSSHNIVRHPDMAKSVYKELWETIKKGKTWRGSIKNRAKNGEAYYVEATIIPLYDESHLEIKEYIGIRFLTTKKENEKREFKKKVITAYQEFRKNNYEANKKIEVLEKNLSFIHEEEDYVKSLLNECKHKNKRILSQVEFYENEIKLNNEKYHNIIENKNNSLNTVTSNYKKLLVKSEFQEKEIGFLTKDGKLRKKEIVSLNTKLNEQSKIIRELRDTIKHIDDMNKK